MNWVRAYASSVRSGSAPPASHSFARAFRRPGRAPLRGLPLRMDGQIGDAAANALRFAERLKAALAVDVFTQDERLTSYEAEQMMIERGFNRETRRARSDEFAALLILEDFLASSQRVNRATKTND